MKKIIGFFVVMLFLLSTIGIAIAQDTAEVETTDAEDEIESSETGDVSFEEVDIEPVLISAETEIEDETEDEAEDELSEDLESAEDEEAAEPIDAQEVIDSIEQNISESLTEEEIAALEDELAEGDEPSITPNQPILWGLKRAIENIDRALTFNRAEKARKGLVHARERLLEVNAMIQAKRFGDAEKAQNAYNALVDEVAAHTENSGDGAEQGLVDTAIINKEELKNRLLLRNIARETAKAENENQQKVLAKIQKIEERTEAVREKVQEKAEKSAIRLKATEDLSEDEVAEVKNQVKQQVLEGAKEAREIAKSIRQETVTAIKEARDQVKEAKQTGASAEEIAQIRTQAIQDQIEAVSKRAKSVR